jgi:hypothetical protein
LKIEKAPTPVPSLQGGEEGVGELKIEKGGEEGVGELKIEN